MECGGLVHSEPSKGRRFRDCNYPTKRAPSKAAASPRLRKRKARRRSPPGPVNSLSLRQLQVKEDAHNERKQRQCLYEYQTQ
jgi:hypothetical protein